MNSLLYFIAFYIIREILVEHRRKIYSRQIKWFMIVIIGLTLTNCLLGCLVTDITLLIILGLLYIFYLVELRCAKTVENISDTDDFTWD